MLLQPATHHDKVTPVHHYQDQFGHVPSYQNVMALHSHYGGCNQAPSYRSIAQMSAAPKYGAPIRPAPDQAQPALRGRSKCHADPHTYEQQSEGEIADQNYHTFTGGDLNRTARARAKQSFGRQKTNNHLQVEINYPPIESEEQLFEAIKEHRTKTQSRSDYPRGDTTAQKAWVQKIISAFRNIENCFDSPEVLAKHNNSYSNRQVEIAAWEIMVCVLNRTYMNDIQL
jgi:hypothetical protein